MALGCQGNALGRLVMDAKQRGLLASHDQTLTDGIVKFLDWARPTESDWRRAQQRPHSTWRRVAHGPRRWCPGPSVSPLVSHEPRESPLVTHRPGLPDFGQAHADKPAVMAQYIDAGWLSSAGDEGEGDYAATFRTAPGPQPWEAQA